MTLRSIREPGHQEGPADEHAERDRWSMAATPHLEREALCLVIEAPMRASISLERVKEVVGSIGRRRLGRHLRIDSVTREIAVRDRGRDALAGDREDGRATEDGFASRMKGRIHDVPRNELGLEDRWDGLRASRHARA